MWTKIGILKKDELIRGSLILLIMMGVFNFLNYVFHFSMARLLGPADYGVLAVLMSLLYIFSVPCEAIQTIISKYTSKYAVNKELGKMKSLLFKALKKGVKIGALLFLIYIPVSFFLSGFLKIQFSLLLIAGALLFIYFLNPISRGILQGRKKFRQLGENLVTDSSIRIVFAITLVLIGFKVYGAILSILIGTFSAFFIAFLYMKDVLKSKEEKIDTSLIYSYSGKVFIAMMSIVLIYSLDIILAKRFFPSEIAGQYAVASMLGKIIFFGTRPIAKAMFPLTSARHEKGKKTVDLLKKSLKFVLLLAVLSLILYIIFPKLVIQILFGSAYVNVYKILFFVGLSLTFLSFSNIFILYGLSINKIKKSVYFLFFFVILEIVLLSVFHSNLMEFAIAFLTVNFLMFVYSIFLIK